MLVLKARVKVTSQYRSRVFELILNARPRLTITHNLEFKNCFGAVAGYVRGKIFISCGWFGVALKLPRESIEQIISVDGGRHLRYFKNGHVKKDYVILPPNVTEDKARFKSLLSASIQFVLR